MRLRLYSSALVGTTAILMVLQNGVTVGPTTIPSWDMPQVDQTPGVPFVYFDEAMVLRIDRNGATDAFSLVLADSPITAWNGSHTINWDADFGADATRAKNYVIPGASVYRGTLTATDGLWIAAGTATVTRRWQKNGVDISGATGQAYAAQAVAGSYRRAETQGDRTVYSAPVEYTPATMNVTSSPLLFAVPAGVPISQGYTPAVVTSSNGAPVTETVVFKVGGVVKGRLFAATLEGQTVTAEVTLTAEGTTTPAGTQLGPVALTAMSADMALLPFANPNAPGWETSESVVYNADGEMVFTSTGNAYNTIKVPTIGLINGQTYRLTLGLTAKTAYLKAQLASSAGTVPAIPITSTSQVPKEKVNLPTTISVTFTAGAPQPGGLVSLYFQNPPQPFSAIIHSARTVAI